MSSLRVLSLYCNMYGLFGNVHDVRQRQRKWYNALLTPGGLLPVSHALLTSGGMVIGSARFPCITARGHGRVEGEVTGQCGFSYYHQMACFH